MRARPDRNLRATNSAILDAARGGDPSAWAEIVRRYESAVRAAVASYRLNSADSADAVQNTWLHLFEHAVAIRDPEKLGGWLTTTARRECLAQIRRQRVESSAATIDTVQSSPELLPEVAVILSETRHDVRSATSALSSRARTIIDAMYYHPCGNYEEIARRTGMPIGSIGPTHLRTMRRLRHRLSVLMPEAGDA